MFSSQELDIKKILSVLLIAALLVVAANLVTEDKKIRHGKERRDIIQIAVAIYLHKLRHGYYPVQGRLTESIKALGGESHRRSEYGGFADQWGNEYQYHFPAKYGSCDFDLYSFGANRLDEHGDGDDITAEDVVGCEVQK